MPEPDRQKRSLPLGLTLLLGGALTSFFLVSLDKQLRHGPLFALLATMVAGFGVLELCGLLRATDGLPRLDAGWLTPRAGEPRWMAPRIGLGVAVATLVFGALIGGFVHLPWVLTLALLALVPSALRRAALFVFVSSSLLYLPMLGHYGLWDPWETHYGEVAREILSRDDWITLWQQQDEWFRSKPIFIFWIEAFTWGALGIPFGPDQNPAHLEWAIRLPIYLLSEAALLAAYAAIARVFGKRAGVLSALVLMTTPYFFFLAHQAITDMPFVATMSVALCLLAIALETDEAALIKRVRIGPFQVSWQNALLFALVVVALPQIVYLISRNLTFVTKDFGFWPHRDEFAFGSPGNDQVPGNKPSYARGPYLTALAYQPFAQGILWAFGLVALVWMLRKERRSQSLAMYGFYLFASFAWMAKGIPGFGLPGLIAALYLLVTNRWSLLLTGKLRIGAGVLVIAVTGLPWYVAMYARLGPFFTDRLLIHDHINRLASGVHGDTGSIQYFLWQLGYGAFPWLGLFPVGFIAFRFLSLSSDDEARARERRTLLIFTLWAAAAFTLFNAMITKFHHYIFPAVPPLALLVGIVLDRLLGDSLSATPRVRRAQLTGIAIAALSPIPIVLGVAGRFGDVRGVIPKAVKEADQAGWIAEHTWNLPLCIALISLGMIGLACAWFLFWRDEADTKRTPLDVALGAALIGASVVIAFAGRDLSWNTPNRPLGHERLIGLFIYNYSRPFPAHLDYRPILTGFAVVLFGLLFVASIYALRKTALYAMLGCTFAFSVWALDVYQIDLTPHWSQRDLVKRYYAERKNRNEPLIAWQMNWKGENLYTGNRVHVFVQLDNKGITKWLEDNPGKRAYFMLEHSRLASFKRLMGTRSVEELTSPRDNNKFLLVRANI
jgi:4-amino-4-deoxy-L-arabinose transferase-like glycosyltransferase